MAIPSAKGTCAPKVKPAAACGAPQAPTLKKTAEDTAVSLGQDAVNLSRNAVDYAKANPGTTAAMVAGTVLAGVAIAHPDVIEKAAAGVENAVVDHPLKSAAVAGIATYVVSKGDGQNILGTAENFAKQHPLESGLMAAAATFMATRSSHDDGSCHPYVNNALMFAVPLAGLAALASLGIAACARDAGALEITNPGIFSLMGKYAKWGAGAGALLGLHGAWVGESCK